jgi:hypothetical protein
VNRETLTHADIVGKILRREYCPPLDEPLLLGIVSDYDLDLPEERRDVINILSQLKKSAFQEENAEFDPTGTSGSRDLAEDCQSVQSRSATEDKSTSNDVTSVTSVVSGLQVDGSSTIGTELESQPQEKKLEWLRETFPNIIPFEISNTLKKCNGNLNNTVDNLLNLSFLPKGVDGFGKEEHLAPGRKGRSKKKSRTTDSSRASSVASPYPESSPQRATNIWEAATDDVEFICARTTLDPKTVKSVWHANGTSLPATIRALAIKQAATLPALADAEATIQIRVIDLKQDFQHVHETQLFAILDLARNIPSAAHELVQAMITVLYPDAILSGDFSGYAQYKPVTLDSDTERPSIPNRGAPSSSSSSSLLAKHSSNITDHSLAASTAFQQAGLAFKRGKSDRLMGGAAAYYSQVGQEHMRLAKQQSAAIADSHVAAQSSSTHIDLHGVSVANAVRIARTGTENWWEGLGDAKYYSGGNNVARIGFRIITGVGKHSKEGALRIGPAVSKMLMWEGWKAEILAGEIIVRGRKG